MPLQSIRSRHVWGASGTLMRGKIFIIVLLAATFSPYAFLTRAFGAALLPATQPAGTLVLEQHTVTDGRMNCAAYTILVPREWHLEGVILWGPFRTPQQMVSESILAPDGSFMAHYPVWQFHSEAGAPDKGVDLTAMQYARAPASPVEYLEQHVLKQDRTDLAGIDLKVVSTRDDTEAAVKAVAPPKHIELKRVTRRINYRLQQIDFEEDYICTLVKVGPPSTRPGEVQVWWCVCQSFRAPRGTLDGRMGVFTAIDQSRRFDVQWFSLVMQQQEFWKQNFRNFLQDQMNEQLKRIAIQAQATRQVAQVHRDAWAKDQAERDRLNRAFVQHVNDTTTYKSPFGNQSVVVPSGYSHVYMNSNGNVILTNDHSYVPPKDAKSEWRAMDKGS